MKIAVDATPLLLNSAGVKGLLYHWLQAMQVELGEQGVQLYPPMAPSGALRHVSSIAGKWDTWRGIAMAVANQRFGVRCAEWFVQGCDLFHCSNQTRTPPRNIKLTATLHDLTCWKMPEVHTPANVQADIRYAEQVLRRADGLLAISEHSRRDAIEVLNIAPERIVTVYCGIGEEYFNAPPARRAKPYVLHVGTIEPRKNVDRLLDAWAALRPDLREQYDLVLIGPAGWNSAATITRLQSNPAGVRWLGYVSEADMPGLTAGATLLAYPSLYEGFGLPLGQAMAAGVACLTSNVSCLPEVAAGGARLVDPLSVGEITSALESLLESPGERERLGRVGRERALSCYRWPIVAKQSAAFFQRVIDA